MRGLGRAGDGNFLVGFGMVRGFETEELSWGFGGGGGLGGRDLGDWRNLRVRSVSLNGLGTTSEADRMACEERSR